MPVDITPPALREMPRVSAAIRHCCLSASMMMLFAADAFRRLLIVDACR